MSRFNELLFNYLIFNKCQIQKNYDALINKNKNCQINDSHLQKYFTLNNNVIYIFKIVRFLANLQKRKFKGTIFFLAANFISNSSFILLSPLALNVALDRMQSSQIIRVFSNDIIQSIISNRKQITFLQS